MDKIDERCDIAKDILFVGGESVELDRTQAHVVPKGVLHRTRAQGCTSILMVEKASVTPTGDYGVTAVRTSSRSQVW